jgi:hypothetical protein
MVLTIHMMLENYRYIHKPLFLFRLINLNRKEKILIK